MKLIKRTIPLLVLGLVAFGTTRQAQAAGTTADTQIINSASMTYAVGGVAQVPPPPATSALTVDRKINFTVSHIDANYVYASPGQLKAVLTFKVQNTGNSPMTFKLSAFDLAGGSVTPFTGPPNVSNKTTPSFGAFAESTTTQGYDAADIGNYKLLELDAFTYAYVVVDIPTTISAVPVINGDVLAYSLKAQAVWEDGVTVITQNQLDTISHYGATRNLSNVLAESHPTFAGGAEGGTADDGIGFDRNAFLVRASVLSLSKTSAIISDPINGTTNPKAIPGAIVEHIITITNTGAVAADSVTIQDLLGASTTLQLTAYASTCANMSMDGGTTWTAGFLSLTCSGNAVNADTGSLPAGSIGATAMKVKYQAVIN